ncbi:MAG: PEGA domain-containing protein [Acidobacteriia bacterium]|nr:PEGA domain-containing protein [Terriglobia bacterium]
MQFKLHSVIAVLGCAAFAGSMAAQDTGYVKAVGKPGDAGVFINGQYAGPATRFTIAEKYPAPVGEVEVTIKDPRYDDFTTKVTVQKHKTAHIKYTMKMLEPAKPPFGRLRFGGGEPESFLSVSGGDTGAVYINDRFYGYIDELNNVGGGLLLNPGTYNLHVSSPRFGEINQKVTIEADKVTVIPLQTK